MRRAIISTIWKLIDKYTYVSWDKFEPEKWKSTVINKRGDTITNNFISLDTETAHNHDKDNLKGWIYQWAFTYGDKIVYGRKPSQLMECFKSIIKVNHLGCYAVGQSGAIVNKLPIYVHNLSFDYEFLIDWLEKTFDAVYPSGETNQKTLAIGNYSVICYEIQGLLFKCSYKLTQKSLAQFAKDIGAKHQKLVDTVDYDEIYYQDTPLNKTQWKYMFYDVITLDECMRLQLKLYEDDLGSVPLTVTGYVRREVRLEFQKKQNNYYKFRNRRLSIDQYQMCRDAFSGGLTHGNRYLANITLRINEAVKTALQPTRTQYIKHRDFRSHYPSQQRCYDFPMSKPLLYYDIKVSKYKCKLETLVKLMNENKGFLAKIVFEDIELKDKRITLPYIQCDKAYKGRRTKVKMVEDNGRLLKLTGQTELTVNEDDLKWIIKQYKFKYAVIRVVTFLKGKLPDYITNVIDRYFKGKTDFKDILQEFEAQGIPEAAQEFIEAYNNLMIAKGMVNGIYGMSATDPIRVTYSRESGVWTKHEMSEDEAEDELDDFYNNFANFMNYQFGVWTTSHARNELLEFAELIGWENVLYVDTDSIFYFSDDELEAIIETRNAELRGESEAKGAYITTNKGKKVHYNQFELEKETIVAFRFLHAKCYAYITREHNKVKIGRGKDKGLLYVKKLSELGTIIKAENMGDYYDVEYEVLHTTIAGVKKKGRNGNTRPKELGTIDNLKEGFVFYDCGGLEKKHVYHEPTTEVINGHEIEYASSCCFFETTKTLHSMENLMDSVFSVSNEMECA